MAASSSDKALKSTKPKGFSTTNVSHEHETIATNTSQVENKTDKKAFQGIVIDGKTYTCATCKSGHRVGVCKHAKERPMKATHPPGRPAAGATKKIVCDCPKDCRCAKKDCKCPRQCACIQTMYLLVYIPGIGEEGMEKAAMEEEKGTWKIDKEVTTDLKGNILSEEEIKLRLEQKEVQRDGQKTPSSTGTASEDSKSSANVFNNRSRSSSGREPQSPSEAKPKAIGGCCQHKQALQIELKRKRALESEDDSPRITSKSAPRCNCGIACRCAFCPEHSNNATSHDVVRQQFNLYQQNHDFTINTMPNPFNTGMAQNMSCMGGQPRFALSRHPAQPSLANFGQAFPSGGGSGTYMIAYPMVPRYHPSTPLLEAQPVSAFSQVADINGSFGPEPPVPHTQISVSTANIPSSDIFNIANYDIGEALVASGGPDGWQQSAWPNTGLPTPDFLANYGDPSLSLADDQAFDNLDALPDWNGPDLPQNDFMFSHDTNNFSDHHNFATPILSQGPSDEHGENAFSDQFVFPAMESSPA